MSTGIIERKRLAVSEGAQHIGQGVSQLTSCDASRIASIDWGQKYQMGGQMFNGIANVKTEVQTSNAIANITWDCQCLTRLQVSNGIAIVKRGCHY